MRVQVNPNAKVNGQPLTVTDPATGKPFPSRPFTLSPRQLADPRVLRLLPRGVPGGVFGDLVPVESAAPSEKKPPAK